MCLPGYSWKHRRQVSDFASSVAIAVYCTLFLNSAAPSGPVRSIIAVTEPTASHTAAINVSWVPPTLDDRNGVVTAYRVTYYPSDGSAPSTVRFVSFDDLESNDGQENARSVVITNLDGHRPYEVFVSACVDLDDGKACGPDASVLIHTLETSTMHLFADKIFRKLIYSGCVSQYR